MIRLLGLEEQATIYEIINDAASAYKGVIPEDRYHEPYMGMEELEQELQAGVVFWGLEEQGVLIGVMGLQDKGDVALIRHAYVRTAERGKGVGGKLLTHLLEETEKPILIGTWAAAEWAIAFYQKYGFKLQPSERKSELLAQYWTIPARQVETSVVLASPNFV